MPDTPHLWMRHESRPTERRAPLTPGDAGHLVSQGVRITVEESDQRVFPLADYAAAGCATAPTASWAGQAPTDAYVLGLKELPDGPDAPALRHRHIYFGHAYKGQAGATELLARFTAGGGALLDMEYLTDDAGRRVAAFGYWAGYIGAALAVLHRRGRLTTPLAPMDRPALDALLGSGAAGDTTAALVIGALGRSGRGACDALTRAGLTPTRWDVAETREIDRAALLGHDLLVNTVLTVRPVPPFLTHADLDEPGRRLSVVSDVTCDVTSECNVLPVYEETTTWESPVSRLREGGPGQNPADLIAIDNLPSLLPAEASTAFSAELTPHLARLTDTDPVWARALRLFEAAAADTAQEASLVR
ncbi:MULTISPECIES: saccharopine dehydrogenase [unclassified Streptomyces]|uniref:saccharopine dehydrogenase n=1 Tax=unclassified Streptomyces TaxID=2593676 RepID=UPI001BE85361|nr:MULTISPECIES: saccharopine dehydrogenase [unclassified Streptomyces]MBT2402876.1 saccharopine dehydrogenase [Streptomyces sp. ISL-21]MBT2454868.1 saccharopine dehydrogenase [Streptomyces sp. ISL-86]MBT2612018.1 saccharopine dehydrogenase [Streptomyces sp. ISL-87]